MKNENFKCAQCGNSELYVFSVAHSKKMHSFFVGILIVISICVFFVWINDLSIMYKNVNDAIKNENVLELVSMASFLGIYAEGLFSSLSMAIILVVLYMLLPYKNKNVTEYYCPCCGRQAPIEEIHIKSQGDNDH